MSICCTLLASVLKWPAAVHSTSDPWVSGQKFAMAEPWHAAVHCVWKYQLCSFSHRFLLVMMTASKQLCQIHWHRKLISFFIITILVPQSVSATVLYMVWWGYIVKIQNFIGVCQLCVCVCVCVVYFAVQSTKTSTWSQKKVSCCCWLLLCSAIFRSQADSLHLHVILHEWLAFYSALKKKNPPMCLWCTYSTDMAGATLTASVLALCVYTIQPCPMSLQTKPYICIRKVHACLDVTCYLHF